MNTRSRILPTAEIAERLARVEGVNRIYRAALPNAGLDDLGKVILEVAEDLTGAQLGFFYAFEPATGNIQKVVPSARAAALVANPLHFFNANLLPLRRHVDSGIRDIKLDTPCAGCALFVDAPVRQNGDVIAGLFLLMRAAEDFVSGARAALEELNAATSAVLESKRTHIARHMHERFLVAELQHRVRNLLTVVRSVFNRTVEADGTREDIFDHFRGRLDALARTQAMVTGDLEGCADLEDLIRGELLSVGAASNPNVAVSGPEIRLPLETAESMGLAIHELTTNALKYGALQTPGGALDIRWSVASNPQGPAQLDLHWTETGVPMVAINPQHSGFGRELIEDALPYRLGARTNLQFRGGGIRCHISMPLLAQGQRLYG